MSKNKSFFILFLSLKLLNLQAQTREKMPFKPRFAQITNLGTVIPLGFLTEKNKFGFNSGTVLEANVSPHYFARFTWDYFQFRYAQIATIGSQIIDVNNANNGNAFYFSGGYYTEVKKLKYYTFVGAGYTILNDPKLKTELIDNVSYTYLSNQNSSGLSLNWGFGVGYKMSLKGQIKIEANFYHLPFLNNMSYMSIQFGYHVHLSQ
jgi:hypothetical protein